VRLEGREVGFEQGVFGLGKIGWVGSHGKSEPTRFRLGSRTSCDTNSNRL
jgi:hypothetical protein